MATWILVFWADDRHHLAAAEGDGADIAVLDALHLGGLDAGAR